MATGAVALLTLISWFVGFTLGSAKAGRLPFSSPAAPQWGKPLAHVSATGIYMYPNNGHGNCSALKSAVACRHQMIRSRPASDVA